MKLYSSDNHYTKAPKAETYLEPRQAFMMELFVNIVDSLLFTKKKLHRKCLTGLYIS